MSNIIQFAAPDISNVGRGECDRGVIHSPTTPVAFPSEDWLEAARKEYLRRWWAENGDTFEFSRDAYGETP